MNNKIKHQPLFNERYLEETMAGILTSIESSPEFPPNLLLRDYSLKTDSSMSFVFEDPNVGVRVYLELRLEKYLSLDEKISGVSSND